MNNINTQDNGYLSDIEARTRALDAREKQLDERERLLSQSADPRNFPKFKFLTFIRPVITYDPTIFREASEKVYKALTVAGKWWYARTYMYFFLIIWALISIPLKIELVYTITCAVAAIIFPFWGLFLVLKPLISAFTSPRLCALKLALVLGQFGAFCIFDALNLYHAAEVYILPKHKVGWKVMGWIAIVIVGIVLALSLYMFFFVLSQWKNRGGVKATASQASAVKNSTAARTAMYAVQNPELTRTAVQMSKSGV